MKDNVNHPAHYTYGNREVIDIIDEILDAMHSKITSIEAFDLGNTLKYLLRYPFKGRPVEDLEKAKWYIDHLIKQNSPAEGSIDNENH